METGDAQRRGAGELEEGASVVGGHAGCSLGGTKRRSSWFMLGSTPAEGVPILDGLMMTVCFRCI